LCWLHSVGQNHFYVMLLLSQGCCFIQSLLFSYLLQEDSVKFLGKFISVPCQPSGRRGILFGRSSVSNIRQDDVVFRPGGHLFSSSGRKVQGCIRPDVMANRLDALQSSTSSQCSSESVWTTWIYLPDAIQCLTSVMGRWLQPSGRCMIQSG
jgi:hypothetical protein